MSSKAAAAARSRWRPALPKASRRRHSMPIPACTSTRRDTSPQRGSPIFSIAYNTRQVAPDRVPKTYEDLLHPQWRGKMAWPYANTGRHLFMINLRLAWGEEKAESYLKKLSEQKIVNFA